MRIAEFVDELLMAARDFIGSHSFVAACTMGDWEYEQFITERDLLAVQHFPDVFRPIVREYVRALRMSGGIWVCPDCHILSSDYVCDVCSRDELDMPDHDNPEHVDIVEGFLDDSGNEFITTDQWWGLKSLAPYADFRDVILGTDYIIGELGIVSHIYTLWYTMYTAEKVDEWLQAFHKLLNVSHNSGVLAEDYTWSSEFEDTLDRIRKDGLESVYIRYVVAHYVRKERDMTNFVEIPHLLDEEVAL